ncbi:uncharacterized protein LOC135498269 isoform X3 [Lineus longissimus]|uniref:uncharacterized protein LOC135498269 isoform X3 n=1 Tax=Lineus longissimus TaxID=88925 RepID=UPI00315DE520
MPSSGAIIPPSIIALRPPEIGKPLNLIDTETYLELYTESPGCRVYFTTDGTKPNPFSPKVGGKEATFRYKAPFTLKPGKRTLRCLAITRDGRSESSVVTKTFNVEELEPEYSSSEGESDIMSFVSSESDVDFEKERKAKEKKKKEKEEKKKEKEKADKEKEKKKKKGEEKKDKEKKDKEKEKEKEKKKKDEKKDSKDSKALVPSHMPKEAWGTPGAAGAGTHDVDGPFNPTNYSGTQINLWGVPPDQWPALNVGPHGTVFQPAPPKPEAPRITEGPSGISTQQLGNLTNQVMQKLDDTAQMTVKDVRKAIEAAKQDIPVVVPQSKPEPKEPTLMPVSAGNGDVKKQISHIYAHLLDYAKRDPNFRASVSQPKLGKILSADMDESADSYLITIQLGKPGVKKSETAAPPPKKVEKAQAPRRPSKEQAAPPPKKEKPKPEENKRKVAEEVPFFETEEYDQEGTLKPAENFDAETDSEKLRKAMKGLGTDEQAIIDVLGYRSVTQRMQIVKQFKMMFGKDLMKELKSELSSHFLDACLALCRAPDEYDAAELRKAMKGLGTDEDALIEIICTRTSKQMEMIKSTYKRVYNRDLEADIESETSGHYKRLMISLLQASRDENPEFDRNKAKKDAEDLFQAGEKKWGTDESRFNVILCSRSYPHLRAVFEEYEKIAHKDIEESIKSEMSGDLKNGMLTVVRCIKYKPTYFAMALQKAMKGLGTDDNTLVRIIVSRCETDMVQIKAEFAKLFKGTLYDWVIDDVSGDYRKLMCVLIGEPYKKK